VKMRDIALGVLAGLVVAALVGGNVFQYLRLTEYSQAIVGWQKAVDAEKVDNAKLQMDLGISQSIVEQQKALLDTSVPIASVMWCDNQRPETIPDQLFQLAYVVYGYMIATAPEGLQPTTCILFSTISYSEVRGELYIMTTRAWEGGGVEQYVVYLGTLEDQPDKLVVVGHYDVIRKEWVPFVRAEPLP
jgi:hypothetical protein